MEVCISFCNVSGKGLEIYYCLNLLLIVMDLIGFKHTVWYLQCYLWFLHSFIQSLNTNFSILFKKLKSMQSLTLDLTESVLLSCELLQTFYNRFYLMGHFAQAEGSVFSFSSTHRSEAEHTSLWHTQDTDMAGHSHWHCTVPQGSLLFLLGWQAEDAWCNALGTLSAFMEPPLPAWCPCPNPRPPCQTHVSSACWLVQMEVCWWWPCALHLQQVWGEHRHCPSSWHHTDRLWLWFYCSNLSWSPHLPHSCRACPAADFGNLPQQEVREHYLPHCWPWIT